MKLPLQAPAVHRSAGSAAMTARVVAAGVCSTACSLLQAACNKIPFVPSSVCSTIYNCCTGACGSS